MFRGCCYIEVWVWGFFFITGEEEDLYADEMCDAFCDIEETDSGFKTSMDVPSVYFKYIIGKRGETKKRLENETRTRIRIPKQGEEGEIGIYTFTNETKTYQQILIIRHRINKHIIYWFMINGDIRIMSSRINLISLNGQILEYCSLWHYLSFSITIKHIFLAVIVGKEKKGVTSARSRVQILVESARQKQPFTHFLSIPITSKDITKSFYTFKEEVLLSCEKVREKITSL